MDFYVKKPPPSIAEAVRKVLFDHDVNVIQLGLPFNTAYTAPSLDSTLSAIVIDNSGEATSTDEP